MKNTCEIRSVLRAFLYNNILQKFSLFCFLLAFACYRNVPLHLQTSQGALLRVLGVTMISIFCFSNYLANIRSQKVLLCSMGKYWFQRNCSFHYQDDQINNIKRTMTESFSFPISKQNKTTLWNGDSKHIVQLVQILLFASNPQIFPWHFWLKKFPNLLFCEVSALHLSTLLLGTETSYCNVLKGRQSLS